MLKVLLLLENQKNTWHLSHPLHLTALFTAENHASKKSKGVAMNKPMHKPRKLKNGYEQGDNVAVPVPIVDRGRGDPRNILSIITDRRKDTDQYRKGVKAGILSGV
ncbi:hypothetical protein PoB_001113900 [Plakobranchus ocellatus]|uniref:Uncharacterized protein n=1 Tax=Plakobranchus ocellatus TaxID=259542 RepID=A0AAV3YRE6_9GAST|nr:hypothetical protein PoB_001113900 [Plakobranchus ocellatus]